MSKKKSKKRTRSTKRLSKKGLRKYLRRLLKEGSVEVTILRELILTRYFRDSERAIEMFLKVVETAVKCHVAESNSSEFAVCSSVGVMRLKISGAASTGVTVGVLTDLPKSLLAMEGARGTARSEVNCEEVCNWLRQNLADGRLIPVEAVEDHLDSKFSSAHATLALSCIARCPDFTIVMAEGVPCYRLQ